MAVSEKNGAHARIAVEQHRRGMRQEHFRPAVHLLRPVHQWTGDHREGLRAMVLEGALEAVDHATHAAASLLVSRLTMPPPTPNRKNQGLVPVPAIEAS